MARRTLPAYSHRCSPKKFTQHQLFACLVLKEFFRLDYRGVEALLAESDSLRAIIDLTRAPDFTTLAQSMSPAVAIAAVQSAARRGDPAGAKDTAAAVAGQTGGHRQQWLRGPSEAGHSNYFVRRRVPYGKTTGKWQVATYRRFPKLAVVCDRSSHLILAAVAESGPSVDFNHWIRAMEDAHGRVRMPRLLADAGYDAEWDHWAARLAYGTRTLIPPRHGRPTKKLPRQYYRRRMARVFAQKRKRRPYRQRAQIETVFSVLKRRLDSSVNANGYWSQCRALLLKAIAHNIMILRRRQVFDRAATTPK